MMSEGRVAERTRVMQLMGVSVGGSAEHALLLASRLDRQRFDVSIALFSGGPLDDEIHDRELRTFFLDGARGAVDTSKATAFSGGRLRFAVGFVRLVRLLRTERIDVLETHTTVVGFLGRLAGFLARTPVRVHMLHSIPGAHHPRPSVSRLALLMERAASKITTHYVAGSHAIADAFVRQGVAGSDRVTTIHYSVDRGRFERDAADPHADLVRERVRGDASVVVGLVGRLERQKGVEFFIDAARALQRREGTRFVVVGDGSLRGDLEERSGPDQVVEFLGWERNVAAVMHSLDVLAIPSRWEAFGIVNLEAMLAEVPVVGSRVEGITEVVEDGVTGLLVSVGDVDALGGALDSLISDADRRVRMGHAGRRRCLDQFLPENMVGEHEVLYRRLVRESR